MIYSVNRLQFFTSLPEPGNGTAEDEKFCLVEMCTVQGLHQVGHAPLDAAVGLSFKMIQ
jgi:hypothetical protein